MPDPEYVGESKAVHVELDTVGSSPVTDGPDDNPTYRGRASMVRVIPEAPQWDLDAHVHGPLFQGPHYRGRSQAIHVRGPKKPIVPPLPVPSCRCCSENCGSSSPTTALFVVAGDSGKLATSPDGITWTQQVSQFGSSSIRGSVWSPERQMFVVVGFDGKISTSPDGTAWTSQSNGFGSEGILSVTWSPALGLFCAVGGLGRIATSPDGTLWTMRTSGTSDALQGVAWGMGFFVAVGDSGTLLTSSDGITWTPRTSAFGSTGIKDVACNGILFLAVGSGGTTSHSTDGIVWTQISPDAGGGPLDTVIFTDVDWGGQFLIAPGDSGKIAATLDGITFTTHSDSLGSDTPAAVAWSSDIGLWVIAGTNGSLATSPDGVTWTSRTSGFSSSLIWTAVSSTASGGGGGGDTFRDDFGRTITGSEFEDTDNWGNGWVRRTLPASDTIVSVDGSSGTVEWPDGGPTDVAMDQPSGPWAADLFTLTARMKLAYVAPDFGVAFIARNAADDSESSVSFGVSSELDDATITIEDFDAGTDNSDTVPQSVGIAADQWFLVKWERSVSGTSRFKLWIDGDAEPDWAVSIATTSAVLDDVLTIYFDSGQSGSDHHDQKISVDWIQVAGIGGSSGVCGDCSEPCSDVLVSKCDTFSRIVGVGNGLGDSEFPGNAHWDAATHVDPTGSFLSVNGTQAVLAPVGAGAGPDGSPVYASAQTANPMRVPSEITDHFITFTVQAGDQSAADQWVVLFLIESGTWDPISGATNACSIILSRGPSNTGYTLEAGGVLAASVSLGSDIRGVAYKAHIQIERVVADSTHGEARANVWQAGLTEPGGWQATRSFNNVSGLDINTADVLQIVCGTLAPHDAELLVDSWCVYPILGSSCDEGLWTPEWTYGVQLEDFTPLTASPGEIFGTSTSEADWTGDMTTGLARDGLNLVTEYGRTILYGELAASGVPGATFASGQLDLYYEFVQGTDRLRGHVLTHISPTQDHDYDQTLVYQAGAMWAIFADPPGFGSGVPGIFWWFDDTNWAAHGVWTLVTESHGSITVAGTTGFFMPEGIVANKRYSVRVHIDKFDSGSHPFQVKVWRTNEDSEPSGWTTLGTSQVSLPSLPFKLLWSIGYDDTGGSVEFDGPNEHFVNARYVHDYGRRQIENIVINGVQSNAAPVTDTCAECEDPSNPGFQLPAFTPGFMPVFRRQIGDPTTSLDSFICTMESAAMVLDWHTRGAISVWGGQLIPWCGKTEAQIRASGSNLSNAEQAWAHYGQVLDVRTGQTFDQMLACLAEGRAVILQGDYGVFSNAVKCQDSFEGFHAISVYPYQVSDRLLVGDPLCSTFHGVKISDLRAYAEAFGAVVLGASSPQRILFAVSRPWSPAP